MYAPGSVSDFIRPKSFLYNMFFVSFHKDSMSLSSRQSQNRKFVSGPLYIHFLTLTLVSVVVMVMDMENKFARPVAHLYKGQTFGVCIINIFFLIL